MSNLKLEKLYSQTAVRRIFGGVSNMTLWRWRQSGVISEPVQINRRNYWKEGDLIEDQKRFFRVRKQAG